MAFITSASVPFLRAPVARCACVPARRSLAMSGSPPPRSSGTDPVKLPYAPPAKKLTSSADTGSSPESAGYTLGSEGYELDTDALRDKAMEVVNDLGTRPLFYGKIVAYALGGLVTITVLKAVVAAVDSIPILPGGLELIGLGYTAWFVWRYVLFKESREELLEEIEDFLGRAKPGGE